MPTDWRPPELESKRLFLRAIEESDAEAIYLFCSNPNMTRFTLWDTHRSVEDSLFYVRQYAQSRYQEHLPEPMGMILKSDPDRMVMGTLGCFWASQNDGVMELGYNVSEPYWGRGIALEAAQTLIDHVFRSYLVGRIQVRTIAENHSSARVAVKLGMKFDGTLRSYLVRYGKRWDIQVYSLLRDEWVAQKQQETELL